MTWRDVSFFINAKTKGEGSEVLSHVTPSLGEGMLPAVDAPLMASDEDEEDALEDLCQRVMLANETAMTDANKLTRAIIRIVLGKGGFRVCSCACSLSAPAVS